MEGTPGQDQGGHYYNEAEVSQAEMDLVEVSDLLLAGLLALAVFLRGGWLWGGWMHMSIIACVLEGKADAAQSCILRRLCEYL
jgi:hypothetical protein